MYADDTNVTFAASNMIDLEIQINTKLKSINLWLRANKLSLNVAKTEFMIISLRQKLQSINDKTININVDDVKVNQTDNRKDLRLNTDENLSWKEHIHAISQLAKTRLAGMLEGRSKRPVLMFKCVNKFAPVYLYNMFTPKTLSFDLRDASQKLYLPKPRTDYLKRIFQKNFALQNFLIF